MLRRLVLVIRQGWERLAQRWRLRNLPVLPAILVALLVGIAIPMVGEIDVRPTELSSALAADRLSHYAGDEPAQPVFGPAGTVLAQRPVFYWPEVAGAVRYLFQLRSDDGTVWISRATVTRPCYLLSAGSDLVPGLEYEFEVEALNDTGQSIGKRVGKFTVAKPDEELAKLYRRAGHELDGFEFADVMLGYYASKSSPHDVVSGLAAAHAADPQAFSKRIMSRAVDAGYDVWLKRRVRSILAADTP